VKEHLAGASPRSTLRRQRQACPERTGDDPGGARTRCGPRRRCHQSHRGWPTRTKSREHQPNREGATDATRRPFRRPLTSEQQHLTPVVASPSAAKTVRLMRQTEAVRSALDSVASQVPVHACFCFVNPEGQSGGTKLPLLGHAERQWILAALPAEAGEAAAVAGGVWTPIECGWSRQRWRGGCRRPNSPRESSPEVSIST
jgi:hypothetical protein